MENTNTVSIPLVDVLSELTGKRVVMSGDDYVFFDTLEKVSHEVVSKGLLLKEQKNKELLRTKTLNDIQTTYQIESTKNITYKNVLYKGGESSASAIAGAVTLAQSLQETNVKIIALDDSENFMSFDEALELSGMIAKSWRTAFFRYKELKRQISNSNTIEDLESITWEEV